MSSEDVLGKNSGENTQENKATGRPETPDD
jgi:hypothetical protein